MAPADCYFTVSSEDVITHVSPPLRGQLGRYVGHSIWMRMPQSQAVFGPYFEEARATGREIEFVGFYAGATLRVRVVPSGDELTVYPTRLSELNLRTAATLRASLERLASELGARASSPRDRPAPASLRALP